MGKGIAVITGANGDMGSVITTAVAREGYPIVMLCRSKEQGDEVAQRIIAETGNTAITVKQIDMLSLASVRSVAQEILSDGKQIALMMNNAGMMSRIGYQQTADGLEQTVQVNYVSPFLLTTMLLPLMGQGTRIVNMVSLTYAIGTITPAFFTRGGNGAFMRIPVYSNTKLALWLFTRQLAEHVNSRGITVNAADPGIVNTKFIHLDLWFDPLTDIFFRPFINTPAQGAATAISLLLDPQWQDTTGQMFVKKHQRKLSSKFLHHPAQSPLWQDTIALLKAKLAE